MKSRKIVLSVFAAVILAGIMAATWLNGASADKLRPKPEPTQEEFSYEPYARVLQTYVNDKGMVDYAALKQQRDKLDAFITAIGRLDPETFAEWNDQKKIAFWTNAYNGITLQAIIDHYPIEGSWFSLYPQNSIRQIAGVWDKQQHWVMGKKMTLNHIEHKILRVKFNEPRIHMALVCAAMGCPPLRTEPYRGEKLDKQFDDQTRTFLANPDKFRIDRPENRVYISKIFQWFGKDFIETYLPENGFGEFKTAERASLAFMSGYLPEEDADYLRQGKYDLKYLDYDWSLNEQKGTD